MTVSEKVAYLRGLCDGLKLDPESNEGKLFAAVIDVLGDIASDLEDVEENAEDLGEEIDAISDDLSDVENFVFGEDEDEDEEDEDEDEDSEEDEDDYKFDDDEFVYSVTCPSCNEEITISEDVLELGGIECPNCGEKLEFDTEENADEEEDKE